MEREKDRMGREGEEKGGSRERKEELKEGNRERETDMNYSSHLSKVCSRITPKAFLYIHINVYDQEWTTLM